ncbi:hypothetical protein Bca101_058669 [Brassica carinata]
MNTKCVGTVGYTASEYMESRTLSRKANAYIFGVILLELISGQKAFDDHNRSEDYIVNWFKKTYSEKVSFWKSTTSTFRPANTLQSVKEVAELADSCCTMEPKKRVEMSQVVEVLLSVIQIHNKRNQATSSTS